MEDKKLQEALKTIIEIFSQNTKEDIISISSIQFVIKGNADNLEKKGKKKSFAIKSEQPVPSFLPMSCVFINDQVFCG